MSKPVIDMMIWDDPKMNAIQRILRKLPKYDYELMDAINKMDDGIKMAHMCEFLFTASKFLMDREITKIDAAGMLHYVEGGYSIHYGFKRSGKTTDMVTIYIRNPNNAGDDPYITCSDTVFFLAMKISKEEYNMMKIYILNKCIGNKVYMDKIFHRLYGM